LDCEIDGGKAAVLDVAVTVMEVEADLLVVLVL
jgi:hypothetical protein